jgi:hypothetical protein
LKNSREEQLIPKKIKNKKVDKKQEVIDNMENETVTKLPIVSDEWIKENLFKNSSKFINLPLSTTVERHTYSA